MFIYVYTVGLSPNHKPTHHRKLSAFFFKEHLILFLIYKLGSKNTHVLVLLSLWGHNI